MLAVASSKKRNVASFVTLTCRAYVNKKISVSKNKRKARSSQTQARLTSYKKYRSYVQFCTNTRYGFQFPPRVPPIRCYQRPQGRRIKTRNENIESKELRDVVETRWSWINMDFETSHFKKHEWGYWWLVCSRFDYYQSHGTRSRYPTF